MYNCMTFFFHHRRKKMSRCGVVVTILVILSFLLASLDDDMLAFVGHDHLMISDHHCTHLIVHSPICAPGARRLRSHYSGHGDGGGEGDGSGGHNDGATGGGTFHSLATARHIRSSTVLRAGVAFWPYIANWHMAR